MAPIPAPHTLASAANSAKLQELYFLWDQLSDVPVADGSGALAPDTLDGTFLHFSAGTPREEVWRWFEAQHPQFSVGDVQRGLRLS